MLLNTQVGKGKLSTFSLDLSQEAEKWFSLHFLQQKSCSTNAKQKWTEKQQPKDQAFQSQAEAVTEYFNPRMLQKLEVRGKELLVVNGF